MKLGLHQNKCYFFNQINKRRIHRVPSNRGTYFDLDVMLTTSKSTPWLDETCKILYNFDQQMRAFSDKRETLANFLLSFSTVKYFLDIMIFHTPF